jgi:hypothetical protein
MDIPFDRKKPADWGVPRGLEAIPIALSRDALRPMTRGFDEEGDLNIRQLDCFTIQVVRNGIAI